jgi:3-oxoacyl-[acyl-carrier protein] reductase
VGGGLLTRVWVVTGGSRGIGRAIVLDAAARGDRVVFCARTLGPESDAVVAASDGRALAVAADVAREADVEALFDRALEAHERVDVVVANAGVNRDELLVHMSAEVFDEVIAVNLTGAFLVARRGVQEMLAQGEGGRLVFVSSLSQRGATSQTAYAASKGGLQGLARTIAKEYGGKGIAANLVAVGLVDTALSRGIPDGYRRFLLEQAPLRRAGTPEEVARVVAFLARAGYVNGETVHVSGGLEDVPL